MIPTDSLLTLENFRLYFPLIYQEFTGDIAKKCLDIMRIYIRKTEAKDQYLRFYEATTINPRSYISIFLKDTILELDKANYRDLSPPISPEHAKICL